MLQELRSLNFRKRKGNAVDEGQRVQFRPSQFVHRELEKNGKLHPRPPLPPQIEGGPDLVTLAAERSARAGELEVEFWIEADNNWRNRVKTTAGKVVRWLIGEG